MATKKKAPRKVARKPKARVPVPTAHPNCRCVYVPLPSSPSRESVVVEVTAQLAKHMVPREDHERLKKALDAITVNHRALKERFALASGIMPNLKERISNIGTNAMDFPDVKDNVTRLVDDLLTSFLPIRDAASAAVQAWASPGGGLIPERMVALAKMLEEHALDPTGYADSARKKLDRIIAVINDKEWE